MKRTTALATVLVFLSAAAVSPSLIRATTPEELLQFAANRQFDQLRSALLDTPQEQQDTPIVLFCMALLEMDGDRARTLYERVLAGDTEGLVADRALWRLAQYHYARGYYVRAGAYLQQLVTNFPASSEAGRARRQLTIITESGVEITAADAIPPPQDRRQRERAVPRRTAPRPLAEPQSNRRYAVQVDAFSSQNNADHRVDQLRRLNYRDVRIVPRTLLGRRLYPVWVGGLGTESEAHRFGEAMRLRGTIKHFVVKEIL